MQGKGFNEAELFERFASRAGHLGEVHTPNGVEPLYKIETLNGTLYATDTAELRKAYEASYYKAPNGLFYTSEAMYKGVA